MSSRALRLVRRHHRFLAFCLVGASGVVVNMGVFALVLLLWPGAECARDSGAGSMAVNAAAICGWLVSVLTNFALNDRLTFGDKVARLGSSRTRRLGRYYVSAAVALGMQLAVLNALLWALLDSWLAASLAELRPGSGPVAAVIDPALTYVRALGNLCGIAAGTLANYALADRWVFR